MKKNLAFVLMAMFIIPIFAIFGCEDVSSFAVTVFTNELTSGFTNGNGTYAEGKTVTLTADALQGNTFICWVYQGSTMLVDGADYHISNTEDANGNISNSTLTFTMAENRQGKYTAIFSDPNMVWAKFDSFRITESDPSKNVEAGTYSNKTISFSLSQGDDTKSIYNIEELEVEDNAKTIAENITEVLKLSSTAQSISVSASITNNETTKSFNLKGSIKNISNIDEVTKTTYSYYTKHTDGVYEIVFKLNFNTTEDPQYCYLVLTYKNLGL